MHLHSAVINAEYLNMFPINLDLLEITFIHLYPAICTPESEGILWLFVCVCLDVSV